MRSDSGGAHEAVESEYLFHDSAYAIVCERPDDRTARATGDMDPGSESGWTIQHSERELLLCWRQQLELDFGHGFGWHKARAKFLVLCFQFIFARGGRTCELQRYEELSRGVH